MRHIIDVIDTISYIIKCNKRIKLFCVIAVISILMVVCISVVNANVTISAMSNLGGKLEEYEFILGGEITGIKILSSGVLVIGVDNITSGLREGDILLKLDDVQVESNQDIVDYINMESVIKKGKILASVKRDDKIFETSLKLNFSESTNKYELGLWVKDSSAGVGTISFYEKNNGYFAALGHGITETRENVVVPITSGAIVKAKIEKVKKGYPKDPRGY